MSQTTVSSGIFITTCSRCGMSYTSSFPHTCVVPLPSVDASHVVNTLVDICKTLERIAAALDRLK